MTTTGDTTKWWEEEDGRFWLHKQVPWLAQEELDSLILARKKLYKATEEAGCVVPEIQQVPYGYRTSCLATADLACIATDQLCVALGERDPRKAEEIFARRLGMRIDGEHARETNCGLVVGKNGIRRAIW